MPHPTRVAVDGPPAAGKTTLADELAGLLRAWGREVVRATIDDFLVPALVVQVVTGVTTLAAYLTAAVTVPRPKGPR